MKELMFYDADCQIGSGPAIGICPGVPELIADMDYYGVERALVRHGNLNLLGALQSNLDLAEMLKSDPSGRLTGVWCILPQQCDELPEPDVFFAEMKKNRIGALTLSPYEHRYVPCRLSLGRIMDAAAERKIPIQLQAFAGKWQDLYNFLAEFPRNTYLMSNIPGKWGIDRQLRPLLENYPGFHFVLSGYWVPDGVADLVERYGSKRILYGTAYPRYSQGSGMVQLKHSGLSEAEVADIAGKNLENLLKGAQL